MASFIKRVQDSTKKALTVDSGRLADEVTFKSTKYFALWDTMYMGLCLVSVEYEVISGVLVWCQIPAKIVTVSTLKATSLGCQKFWDLCTADPSSPLY